VVVVELAVAVAEVVAVVVVELVSVEGANKL